MTETAHHTVWIEEGPDTNDVPDVWFHDKAEDHRITLEDLARMEVPEATESYVPVSHFDMARNTLHIADELLGPKGYELIDAQYTTSNKDRRFIGAHIYKTPEEVEGMHFCVALRNSTDKSMRAAIGMGAQVKICRNMALLGERTISHLHTGEVIKKLKDALILEMFAATTAWQQIREDREAFEALSLSQGSGYEKLFDAHADKIITDRQLIRAAGAWRTQDAKAGITGSDGWGLYNAITYTYDEVPIQKKLATHSALHEWAQIYLSVN